MLGEITGIDFLSYTRLLMSSVVERDVLRVDQDLRLSYTIEGLARVQRSDNRRYYKQNFTPRLRI